MEKALESKQLKPAYINEENYKEKILKSKQLKPAYVNISS